MTMNSRRAFLKSSSATFAALAISNSASVWADAPGPAEPEAGNRDGNRVNQAARVTLSLNGQWQIAESKLPHEIPSNFSHSVPVPGLAHLANPAFLDVDRFLSRERIAWLIARGQVNPYWMVEFWNGKVEQNRNYFWYHRTFHAPSARAVAKLMINKAQFGTAVWLNGRQLAPEDDAWRSEYPGCFTSSKWDLSRDIRWSAENTLVVRIGAHPAVLPADFPTGSDFEKTGWTPGIYDDVSVLFFDNPEIESVQIAPRIASDEIIVQATVRNHSNSACLCSTSYVVTTWKTGEQVASANAEVVSLESGKERILTQVIKIPQPRLWSPEDPFLYVLETRTNGDSVRTRFGMRELQFEPATKRAYLNGKLYYLRGSNIALHRFFEDPLCSDLPWDDTWIRRLLGTIPKKMSWNYFRFSIGPAPQRWLDVCDEMGLMVQYEFPVWTGGGWFKEEGYSRTYNADEMIRQFRDWMRDNWNHPSVVVWDAANETRNEIFNAQVIPAVRALDLSRRPWEASYNPPGSPGDLEEFHGYLFDQGANGKLAFKMSDLENMDGKPVAVGLDTPVPSTQNAVVINEYGALWLNRDGTPTFLTANVYHQLMGTDVTGRKRLNEWAYILAGLTEYWRAHRQMAGVDYFVYLTCNIADVPTSDNWSDVRRLELDPAFVDYVGQAFKPLGVYINFFHPTLEAGSPHEFLVKMVNDYDRPISGELILTLETKNGDTISRAEQSFNLASLGAGDISVTLQVPDKSIGDLILKATARPANEGGIGSTMSRRWLSVTS